MYAVLALILVALAVFTVAVVRRTPLDPTEDPEAAELDREQLRGFAYVGAGSLVLLAVVVVGIGLRVEPDGLAENLGILGAFAYLVYLVAAWAVGRLGPRIGRRSGPEMAPDRKPGSNRTHPGTSPGRPE